MYGNSDLRKIRLA